MGSLQRKKGGVSSVLFWPSETRDIRVSLEGWHLEGWQESERFKKKKRNRGVLRESKICFFCERKKATSQESWKS